MATSPSHQFGQIIGDVLEAAIEPMLVGFADKHGLFLDKKGVRSARTGSKVSWVDAFSNTHDLDYVLERGGTDSQIGTPVAFIETAWRRYTKHSRNKAQEIQGAILPLVATHRNSIPFIGVILAGVFTDGAIRQLRSQGFSVVYFPYGAVVEAFAIAGIDASFDEQTPDKEFARKVAGWKALPTSRRQAVQKALVENELEQIKEFIATLEAAVLRRIELVRILPLHGVPTDCNSVDQAIQFLRQHSEKPAVQPLVRFEIEIRYSNGDRIQGTFGDKGSAITFLTNYMPPSPHATK